jgi:tight adherence protein C
MIGLPAFGLIWVVLSPQKGPLQWLFFGMLLIAGPKLPTMWLQRRIKRNEKTIQRALPFAVDLLVACLEGGLSLEAALDKVASETDSLLSEEIQQTLAEIALGRPSVEALRDLGTRTGIADLKRLTETVLQAERMGVSIAEAMRTLADESRTRRRQRAEEEARKAPIKMLPVMVCTTLPAIGAVVMTPALINFTRALSVFVHK